jgi:uncharacterized damage-inducible protein DinB
MNLEIIRELYEYHYDANHQIFTCIEKLIQEKGGQQDLEYKRGPLFNQIFHMLSAEYFWFASLKAGKQIPYEDVPNIKAYTRFSAVRELYDDVEQMVRDYLQTLTEADLKKTITYQLSEDESPVTNEYWQIILQIYSHSIEHRTRVLMMLSELGQYPPELDFINYLWAKAGAKHP